MNWHNCEPQRKRDYSINKRKGCDEWCCSRMELVGHLAGWESLTSKSHHYNGWLIIKMRAISTFIVTGGGLNRDQL